MLVLVALLAPVAADLIRSGAEAVEKNRRGS